MSTFLEKSNEMIEKMIEIGHKKFDPEYGMLTRLVKGHKGAYHTNYTGLIHHTRDSAEYINKVCYMKKAEYYDEVRAILKKLPQVQDSREGSPTYGLWGYVCEEPIEDMLAPDYNNADFTGKHIAYVLKHCPEALDAESTAAAKLALTRAAQCSINRNVSADYTNISFMSLNTIIGAGELCDRPDMLEIGKKRLKTAYDYQMHNGGFSEFNSPTYSPLVVEELTRLISLTDDEEIIKMSKELIYMAWEEILARYDVDRCELCPPMMRAYRTSASGMIEELLFAGTKGEFGSNDNFLKYGENEPLFIPELLSLDVVCPEELIDKYLRNKPENPRFIEKTFYKKNDLRSEGEDTVIVRNLQSPDLKCFGYMTDNYQMGAFEKTDMWVQRRSSMVSWGKGDTFGAVRIRCFNYDYDYCSGMVYTNQYENVMLSHTGFATDRGDFHYILDNVIKGRGIKSQLTTKKLFFKFGLEGTAQDAKVTQNGHNFVIDSGDVKVYINIYEALFCGQPMEILYNEEEKQIELICFDEEKTVDFAQISQPTYVVFTMSVNEEAEAPVTIVENDKVTSTLEFCGKKLTLSSYATPKSFDDIIENTKTARE